MPSERALNPAQAHRKAEKAKALKKSKAQLATQRAEKLARRNPQRLDRQIETLKEAEAAGTLRPKDKQTLETLQRDAQAIRKAREKLGVTGREDGGRREGGGGGGGGSGGAGQKRRRWEEKHDSDSRDGRGKRNRSGREMAEDAENTSDSGFSTDESVRRISMPRDTPPPIPSARRNQRLGMHQVQNGIMQNRPDTSPATDVGAGGATAEAHFEMLTKTVYEAAPAVRDLQKEATAKFVPAAVREKINLAKGKGRLLEEEEMDALRSSGYVKDKCADDSGNRMLTNSSTLDEEERRFQGELGNISTRKVHLRNVTVEDANNE